MDVIRAARTDSGCVRRCYLDLAGGDESCTYRHLALLRSLDHHHVRGAVVVRPDRGQGSDEDGASGGGDEDPYLHVVSQPVRREGLRNGDRQRVAGARLLADDEHRGR